MVALIGYIDIAVECASEQTLVHLAPICGVMHCPKRSSKHYFARDTTAIDPKKMSVDAQYVDSSRWKSGSEYVEKCISPG
jgi:hypothetical protein